MSSRRHRTNGLAGPCKKWLGERSKKPRFELANFDPTQALPCFEPEEFLVTVQTAPTLILVPNPNRVVVTFFQAGFIVGTGVAITWGGGVITNRFMTLGPVGRLEFKYADYGALVGYDWYAIAQGAPSTISIWSVNYVPV